MHEIDRKAEAEAFLSWLKQQISEQCAETLVVAGDIFDTASPSVESRRLYYAFLASLVDSPCKNVILIGGNHDSSALLDAARDLLEVLNIRVVGSVSNLSPSDMCFELRGSDGAVNGICMAVPFVREVELRNLLSDSEKCADSDLYAVAYKKLYALVYEEAERLRGGRNIPIVATGHLYAAALEGRLSEKKSGEKGDDGMKVLDVLGTLGKVPPSVFPPADYVALGHIHYASTVAGNEAVRYSGSPFVMGFDEAGIPHCVLCVELAPFAPGSKSPFSLSVSKIETPRTHSYRRISGTLAQVREQLFALANAADSADPADSAGETARTPLFLELCYKREIGVNAQDYLDEAVRSLPNGVSVVSWKIADSAQLFAGSGFDELDASEIRNLDDKEIFTQLILSKSGLDADSEEGQRAVEKFLPLFLKLAAD